MIRVKDCKNEFFTQAVESCVRWECHFTTEVPGGRGVELRVELWPGGFWTESAKHMSWRYMGMHLT